MIITAFQYFRFPSRTNSMTLHFAHGCTQNVGVPGVASIANARWAIAKPLVSQWQEILDQLFPSLLEWAGPHQPPWLRRLAFGVTAAVVRDAPVHLHPSAEGCFDRYGLSMLPLLNASLVEVHFFCVLGRRAQM